MTTSTRLISIWGSVSTFTVPSWLDGATRWPSSSTRVRLTPRLRRFSVLPQLLFWPLSWLRGLAPPMKSGSLFKRVRNVGGRGRLQLVGGHHGQRRRRQGDVGNDARAGDGDRFRIAAPSAGRGRAAVSATTLAAHISASLFTLVLLMMSPWKILCAWLTSY